MLMNFKVVLPLKKSNRTDPNRLALIRYLKKLSQDKGGQIWALLASELSKTKKRRISVNLSHLNRVTSPGDVVLVPGKVLASGSLEHNLEIAAESFSSIAQEKIELNGGQCLSIVELVEKNPSGSEVKFIK
jgi:large subunit ribosomal protein L18e